VLLLILARDRQRIIYAERAIYAIVRSSSIWRTDTGSSYNMPTENDIRMISAAAAMFSCKPNPLPPASTVRHRTTPENTIMYKPEDGSTNNFETETDINTISRVTVMFWIFQDRLRSNRQRRPHEIALISVSFVKLLVLPVWSTVSTSDLYPMLFSKRCRYQWKWVEHWSMP